MMSEKQSLNEVQFERMNKIKSDREVFEQALQNFDEASRQEITSALELMIELHIDQNDWSDGSLYVNHPLWPKRDELAAELQEVYDKQYRPVLEAGQNGV